MKTTILLFVIVVATWSASPVNGLTEALVRSDAECNNMCLAMGPGCAEYYYDRYTGICMMNPANLPTQATCARFHDTDAAGNDLESIPAQETECCGLCEANPSCNSYAYGYGKCWLKSTVGPFTNAPGVLMGVINRANAACTVLAGTDAPGNDFQHMTNTTPQQCCEACRKNTACNSYATSAGGCWLKGSNGPLNANAVVQTGFPNRNYY